LTKRDPISLQNEVFDAGARKMKAGGKSGLSSPNDQGIDRNSRLAGL
jgi:hypothetical protein